MFVLKSIARELILPPTGLLILILVGAILVWRGHEGRSGWEIGLELQHATEEFWGMDF